MEEALDYFPELEDVHIDIRIKNDIEGSFMQAQPIFRSMLGGRKKRKYKIKISRYLIIERNVKDVAYIPHDVLVGWIGHEMGHLIDYLPRTNLNLIWFGIRYVFSKKFMAEAERRADIFAIERGFSSFLIKSKNYILEQTSLPEKYREKIRKYYLSPEEVMMYLEGELDPVS